MSKDTKKKANPALEDDEVLEDEEETTDADEAEDDTDTDETDEADEADEEEEVEEEPAKKPAKASKAGAKGATKSTKAAKADEEDEGDNLIKRDAPKRKSENSIEAQMTQDARDTKAALAKQPKVRIFIPLGINEKKGKCPPESVTINGYRMELPKGEYVTVPQGVADLIEKHYNMTAENTEAGEAYRLDRQRSHDGMSTDEALSYLPTLIH